MENHFLFTVTPFTNDKAAMPIIGTGTTRLSATMQVALRHPQHHVSCIGMVDDILELLKPYVIISKHAHV